LTHLDDLRRLVGLDAHDERAIARERARLEPTLAQAAAELDLWLREVSKIPLETPLLLPEFLPGFARGRADPHFYNVQYGQAAYWLNQGLDSGLAAAALSTLRALLVKITSAWSSGRTTQALCRLVDLAHAIHAVVFHLGHVLSELERVAARDIARVRHNCEALSELDSDRLLNAYTQHLEWKRRAYRMTLDNAGDLSTLPVSSRECDLGRWLRDGGLSVVPEERAQGLVSAHERLHLLVRTALEESHGGKPQAVLKYLQDIEAASDEIVSILGDCISQRLSALAVEDSLTHLGTRRLFDNDIVKHAHQLQRDGSPLALLLIDVDHFKEVNDRFGHTTGDEVLQRIANALSYVLRSSDRLYRWGGEEFAVLMPAARSEDIFMVAERLRGEIASHSIFTAAGKVRVTVSIGGTFIAGTGAPDADALFSHCDANLRRAKAAGRNRIVISEYGTDEDSRPI